LRNLLKFAAQPVKPITTYTHALTKQQGIHLHEHLQQKQYEFRQVPFAQYAAKKAKTNVVFYNSGKLVIQGKGTQEFVEYELEPLILKRVELGYEETLNPSLLLPRFGIDESGKGDFFGPLCIAGVYVNQSVIQAWEKHGIRDSKNISSDRKIMQYAKLISETPGCVSVAVPIGNEAYNRLYRAMRSVNRMLAWGHARVIENLMLQKHHMNPAPVKAISDQFAYDKATVAKAIMSLGQEIELVQRHKAESDIAVAAASIIARHEFITRLDKIGKEIGVDLPRGSSKEVQRTAKKIVARLGVDQLQKVAKMHFRTAYQAQGLPAPPKKEWKKRK
jgi:ribonuclease HIII